jgi:hypothetical protein
MNAFDTFISRSVKKWAARYNPPAGGRARLLEAASQEAILRNSPPKTIIQLISGFFSPAPVYAPPNSSYWNHHRQGFEWAQGLLDWEMVCRLNCSALTWKTIL